MMATASMKKQYDLVSLVLLLWLCGLSSNNGGGGGFVVVMGQTMNSLVNNRTQVCTGTNFTNLIGYRTILDMNIDQQNELNRINEGNPTDTGGFGYLFQLCPLLFFDLNFEGRELEILLPRSTFRCGPDGVINANGAGPCEIRGGSKQITIREQNNVESVTFEGISFTQFTDTSLDILKESTSLTVNLNKVHYKEYTSNNAIRLQSGATLNIDSALISVPPFIGVKDAISKDFLVSSGGGTLTVTNLVVMNKVSADSIIQTTNGGSTSLSDSVFNTSSIVSVTKIESGSTMTMDRCQFTKMDQMGYVANVNDDNSQLVMGDCEIHDNTQSTINVLLASNSSSATISNIRVHRNTKLDKAFGAASKATVSVEKVDFESNDGVVGTSSMIYATTGGRISAYDNTMSRNKDFIAFFLAFNGGFMDMKNNCLNSGTCNAIGFVSKNSDYTAEDNYVDDSIRTESCVRLTRYRGRRLAVERNSTATDCFTGPGVQCITDCKRFGYIDSCGGNPYPTRAPGAPPPTLAPIAKITQGPQRPTPQIVNPTRAPTPPRPTPKPTTEEEAAAAPDATEAPVDSSETDEKKPDKSDSNPTKVTLTQSYALLLVTAVMYNWMEF